MMKRGRGAVDCSSLKKIFTEEAQLKKIRKDRLYIQRANAQKKAALQGT